jgi:dipeptidyl aminopeptidase/acylaminoacyl peptidase
LGHLRVIQPADELSAVSIHSTQQGFPMSQKTVAAFGTWKSPITAQTIAAGSRTLSSPCVVGDQAFWLEGIAAQGGRVALVNAGPGGLSKAMTVAPFNVRSRVHEYGGGAYLVNADTVYFSNFADNLVYAQQSDAAPRALTSNSLLRHADFNLDKQRNRLIAVQEGHSVPGREAINQLISLGLGDSDAVTVLATGYDFYAAPRLSPNGQQLAWLCWSHPHMPWNSSELWIAEVGADGALAHPRRVAGGPHESLCQPTWSPAGELYVASDRTAWWNLYRVEGDVLHAICPMDAEFAQPHWTFAESMFGLSGDGELVASYIENAISKLIRIDVRTGTQRHIETPFTAIHALSVSDGFVVALASSPSTPRQITRIDLATGQSTVLARCTDVDIDADCISAPQAIAYDTTGGRTAHAFYYAPKNADYAGPAGERPPLVVTSHGGPTGMASNGLQLGIQYWTSRGFAVLDVNYGGSSGYGRDYREVLKGQWGIVDVDDCIAGADYLARQGLVDRDRMAIRGGSASGFTTLCALTFHHIFKAGASHYGVSDLASLDFDTHKFESRYTGYLVAPPETRDEVYARRSPLGHVAKLNCPMIFFQGMDDKVVPPEQSETMVQAMKKRGVPVAYVPFEGEGHGFRRIENIRSSLEAELYFYGRVFGFEPADVIEPVEIHGLPSVA